jgi:hypothetical protein
VRYLILVKATPETEAGRRPAELVAALAGYHQELARAGVLLDASGLQPSAAGFRVRYAGGQRTVVDGPFRDAGGLVAGYTLLQVKSREEAREWARRFPAPPGEGAGGEIEVRPLDEPGE